VLRSIGTALHIGIGPLAATGLLLLALARTRAEIAQRAETGNPQMLTA
jgi:hypothetical protein